MKALCIPRARAIGIAIVVASLSASAILAEAAADAKPPALDPTAPAADAKTPARDPEAPVSDSGSDAKRAPNADATPPASAAEPGSMSLAALVERCEHASLGEGSFPVQDLQLASGGLSVQLRSGRASYVLVGGQVAGIFFAGDGSYVYRSTDTVELPVMAYNIEKGSSLSAEKIETGGLAVRDAVKTLLWWSAGQPPPDLAGTAGPSLADELRGHAVRFATVEESPRCHGFVTRALDAPSKTMIRAEIHGGQEDLLYVLDPVEERSERLSLVYKPNSGDPELKKERWTSVLSEHPLGRDRRDPPTPRFRLTDVTYTLTASSGRDASLSVTETLVAEQEGMKVFRFDMDSTNYASSNVRLETRHMRVKSVTDGSGKPLSFHHENDELLVGLASPARSGQVVKLQFEIDGDFLVRPSGDNYWMLGTRAWLPLPEMAGQGYTVRSTVKVPEPFVPFAPGVTLERRKEGSLNVLESRVDKPVMFTVVLAGKYEVHEETKNGLTVRVASYAGRNEIAMKKLTTLAFGIVEYYQWFLGPFPMSELNILEINEYGWGQAPPGVMFITQEAFNPMLGELNQIYSQGINERFAHEIAHQYWGIAVRMPSFEEQWLTESFAEYSAAIFLKKLKGASTYDALVKHWRGNAKKALKAAPIPLANRLRIPSSFETSFSTRTWLVYDKGAYLLASLHKELGDTTFLTFMKSYQKTFRWQFGTTKDVAGLLQFLTKKDYTPWFEANYWGTGMPD